MNGKSPKNHHLKFGAEMELWKAEMHLSISTCLTSTRFLKHPQKRVFFEHLLVGFSVPCAEFMSITDFCTSCTKLDTELHVLVESSLNSSQPCNKDTPWMY